MKALVWPVAAALLFAFAAGCAHPQIDRDAEHELDEASTRAQARLVHGSCDGENAIGPGCGLVMRHALSEEFRNRFRDRACTNKSVEECENALRKRIDAEMARRYFAADWNGVATTCDLSPPKCDDPVVYERLLVASHNANVQKQYDDDYARIEGERAAKHREATEKDFVIASAAVGVADIALTGGRRCRSYPSAYTSAVVTVCNR